MTKDPHIVVICLDTLRKDSYDAHAPRLSELGTVEFEGMRAAASWSVPSHASMFTGQLPHEHGFTTYDRNFGSLDATDTFLDALDGYETFGVSANVYASDAYGFDGLFDDFVRFSPSSRFPEGMDVQAFIDEYDGGYGAFVRTALGHDHPVASLLNGALLKVRDTFNALPLQAPFDYGAKSIARTVSRRLESASSPTFVFANVMDVHGPHALFRGLDTSRYDLSKEFNSRDEDPIELSREDDPDEAYVRAYRETYVATTDYIDRVLSTLVEDVQASADRPVRVVVTADHGENLGYPAEDGLLHHLGSLSEALLHVPFDVISDAHSGTVDGYGTLLDLGEVVARLRTGEPLDDLARDTVAAEIAGFGGDEPESHVDWWDRAQRAVYRGDRKYVHAQDGSREVFDVSGEPCWQERVDEPFDDELFETHFDEPLDEWAARAERTAADDDVSEDVAARLRDLGYA
jgi:choline-sulfatase